jgi:hypothetical protein
MVKNWRRYQWHNWFLGERHQKRPYPWSDDDGDDVDLVQKRFYPWSDDYDNNDGNANGDDAD